MTTHPHLPLREEQRILLPLLPMSLDRAGKARLSPSTLRTERTGPCSKPFGNSSSPRRTSSERKGVIIKRAEQLLQIAIKTSNKGQTELDIEGEGVCGAEEGEAEVMMVVGEAGVEVARGFHERPRTPPLVATCPSHPQRQTSQSLQAFFVKPCSTGRTL